VVEKVVLKPSRNSDPLFDPARVELHWRA
jgi:hypothetical protein